MSPQRLLLALALLTATAAGAQKAPPRYTPKHFVRRYDSLAFPRLRATDGPVRTYLELAPDIWDVDDDNSTHIRGGARQALVQVDGTMRNNKREGVFTFSLIDSADHSKRFKIWEQEFAGDKLNGQYRTYNLKGTLVETQTMRNDSLDGVGRSYWIDGKLVMSETEYFGGRAHYVRRDLNPDGKPARESEYRDGDLVRVRTFHPNGAPEQETPLRNGVPNGTGRRWYDSGKPMEEVTLVNGQFHGIRRYFYPNGQLWIEEEYRNGLHWNILGNWDAQGKRRDAGTLKGGNGTVKLYHEDGSLRETTTYVNGKEH
ncbi:toxin-antitoxin system YwqK family antitoxin [Flaviaesturariibacter aridisoli]|uniref:Toxin-antitoxin system YwqK family antitoxin n=1 Tax=Flaviaesturariibacter aridisoli TaxID=2545761 RepID=A0A4R4E4J0_9BACT|nr:toxin-antitoxin system YwqK family antitoxin [Flaviaesturariibacter aridisoli]TCZ73630.1 toxin-antitoxin system YwqK family antitoxin [Flaviaesturariibacter aridisoli]